MARVSLFNAGMTLCRMRSKWAPRWGMGTAVRLSPVSVLGVRKNWAKVHRRPLRPSVASTVAKSRSKL